MELRRKPVMNPDLEVLRLKALNLAKSDISDVDVNNLIGRMSRIHAAFLFHSPKTLQSLLRAIGETNSSSDLGWQSFGDKLGLQLSVLKVINNNYLNHEDPIFNTLLHYVQYEDATIGKILSALREMGRFDVIMRVKDLLNELADVIFNHERELFRSSIMNGRSDYGSLQSDDYPEEISPDCERLRDVIIRPEIIPNAPFIMKNVERAPLLSPLLLQENMAASRSIICSESFSRALSTLPLMQSSPTTTQVSTPSSNCRLKYEKKVMLTFAADGADTAVEVSNIFRRNRDGAGRLGVLILGEQLHRLNTDPEYFINAAFHQVNYVVPIVTEGYLKAVFKKVKSDTRGDYCVDAQYVPYIYKLMMTHYTKNGCLNDKVRCLIPNESVDKVSRQLMFAGPLFAVWEKTSSADQFAQRLLSSQA